jgi:hypothetical protein
LPLWCMTSVGRRPSLVLTFTRDVTFVQPGYPISSTPKTLSRQKTVIIDLQICHIFISNFLKQYYLILHYTEVSKLFLLSYRIKRSFTKRSSSCFISGWVHILWAIVSIQWPSYYLHITRTSHEAQIEFCRPYNFPTLPNSSSTTH